VSLEVSDAEVSVVVSTVCSTTGGVVVLSLGGGTIAGAGGSAGVEEAVFGVDEASTVVGAAGGKTGSVDVALVVVAFPEA
jgi:hypothetical protein